MTWLIACFLWAAPPDPIGDRLFPPDLIMAHQSELHIDAKQRDAIIADMQKTQSQLVPLEWQMKTATDDMLKLLEATPVDEAKVIAAADSMMDVERQFKRNHLGLLVRIRNLLSKEQRTKLAELRKMGAN